MLLKKLKLMKRLWNKLNNKSMDLINNKLNIEIQKVMHIDLERKDY